MEFNYALDTQGYRQALLDFSTQIEKGLALANHISAEKKKKIAIIGMGGSALPGEILKCYLPNHQIYVLRDYAVPAYIDDDTLIFIISYSGNTDETINAYRKVARLNTNIIVLSAGGKLEQLALMYKSQYIKIPQVIQPRVAIGYMFFAILAILRKGGMIEDFSDEVKVTIKALQKDVYESFAQDVAKKIGSKIPIIYSSTNMQAAAYLWKIGFNENAKMMAFCNVIPELDHNELCGYETAKGQYYTFLIKDLAADDPRIRKRIEVLKEVLKERGNDAVEIAVRGENQLSKLFSTIYLGYWISYYVALLRGIDPAPVSIIEDFKQKVK
jgi:glucose/mannose-6-phosphate isomerase